MLCKDMAEGKDPDTIRTRFRDLRHYLKLKQSEIARDLHLSNRTISAIEAEGRALTTEHIQAICDHYGIDARYFFGQLTTPEEADLKKRGDDPKLSQLEALKQKIENFEKKVTPIRERDELAQFLNRQHIRSLVELVRFWEANAVERLKDIARGMEAGQKLAEERGAAKQAQGA